VVADEKLTVCGVEKVFAEVVLLCAGVNSCAKSLFLRGRTPC
jgi:hypothetical protein